ncbi:hypothetical protein KIS1582_3821 [Cytobacillus firmus]|uniref:Uncharacterized protein n=1 Tax=Cytobacillus firmus TaxID=1399 RepID=A0A800N8Z0_CYTFI|nr:hypothetical protein KIS1582_3821 [Cytobacillus firmus]
MDGRIGQSIIEWIQKTAIENWEKGFMYSEKRNKRAFLFNLHKRICKKT